MKLQVQQKGEVCRFLRRKNVTSEMMKGYMADALLILMGSKDYADISIGEITEKAGVNRSTFYRNYNSKDAIIVS